VLWLLVVLFAASGCAALIYEIVWFQLLELVIGSSGVSLGVLLATYMGGMCLGSLAYARVVPEDRRPLRIYAFIEAGIGICGLAVLFGLPALDRFYAAHAGHGLAGILTRALLCALCLLAPTVLMGASLPALGRQWETTPHGVSRLGFLYGANTIGAVGGCVLAGFYLLRVHDMYAATYTAAAINAVIAVSAFGTSFGSPAPGARMHPVARASEVRLVYVVIGLSGLCALGAEVVWTRLLSLMLGATVYAFSIILAVFLAGLGIGSAAGSWMARTRAPARIALGLCQLLLAAAVAGSGMLLAKYLPYWPMPAGTAPWLTFRADLLRSACAVFPAACLWGASFPLALAAAARPDEDPGRLAGSIYAANTAGAIAGALGFSLVLIPWIGTRNAERALVVLCALAELVALSSARRFAPALILALLAAPLGWMIPAMPWQVFAYGRELSISNYDRYPVYVGEGMNATVAVSRDRDEQAQYFHTSGKTEASSLPQDMRLQRMLGHLPALLHANPRSVLVVGCGAAVTAGTFVVHPEIQRILICELEPLVPRAVASRFAKENHHVVTDRRTEIVFDDARHYILTSRERFDIITSDPIHPWVKGAATLYSKEYFEMVKRHLNPGGVVTQWVPLYQSDLDSVKSEIATFAQVFPNATLWSNDIAGDGYDMVIVGQNGRTRIDIDAWDRRLAGANYAPVRDSLREVGLRSAIDLLSTYAGQAPDLTAWLRTAQINHDRDLRLQYLAGIGMTNNSASYILEDLVRYLRFPRDLFTGSDEQLRRLRARIPVSR
jgi:spermidine synthase